MNDNLTLSRVGMERSVLGACIESEELLPAVMEVGLTADDFSLSDHQQLFTAMLKMRESGIPLDLLSVCEAWDNPDAYAVISGLIHGVVLHREHVVYHAKVVLKYSRLRNLAKLGEWLTTAAGQVGADPQCLLADTEARLGTI